MSTATTTSTAPTIATKRDRNDYCGRFGMWEYTGPVDPDDPETITGDNCIAIKVRPDDSSLYSSISRDGDRPAEMHGPVGSTYHGILEKSRFESWGFLTIPVQSSDGEEYYLRYEGEFCNGKQHGKGILSSNDVNSEMYEGDFEDGYPHGMGVFAGSDGKVKFEGEISCGRKIYGVFTSP